MKMGISAWACFYALWVGLASAQTNLPAKKIAPRPVAPAPRPVAQRPAAPPTPALPPDVARQLANYSNQLAAVEREIKAHNQRVAEAEKHFTLRSEAGQVKAPDIRARQAANRTEHAAGLALERKKATLRLAEYEYRKRLRLPQKP